jgi:hypothetical protein
MEMLAVHHQLVLCLLQLVVLVVFELPTMWSRQ